MEDELLLSSQTPKSIDHLLDLRSELIKLNLQKWASC